MCEGAGLCKRQVAPQTLLSMAKRLFEAERASLTVTFGPEGQGYIARFDFPGRVSVFCEASGELLAQSKLRLPAVLARSCPSEHTTCSAITSP